MKAFRIGLSSLLLFCAPLHAQFAQQAQRAVSAPLKVSVKPPSAGARAGGPAEFSVQLQNGKSEPAASPKEMQVEIQLLGSAGDVIRKAACKIPAGKSEAQCSLQAPAAGLYKVRALPDNRELLEGSGYILIRPDDVKRSAPLRQNKKDQAGLERIPLLRVAYAAQMPPIAPPVTGAGGKCEATKAHSQAKVILTVNEGAESSGAFRASLESATIQAFFAADDGGVAPSDIFVWLSPDHGELDRQPLVIPKCAIAGEAHLSSKYPVQATILYKIVPAIYAVQAPEKLQASFVRPIMGIGVVPNGTQTLSLIDRVPIVAQFYDIDGNVVPTDTERTVTFVSDNSVISPQQQSITLKPGGVSAQTMILPSWLGKGSIFITADRLKTATHQVDVIGASVILICLVGGLLGGLISFLESGGAWYTRLLVGVAAGIVLTWAYVFGILQSLDTAIAHNYISVFVVAILGGYTGIKTLDFVLKRLGWAI
jgi:hypothetical protein